MEAYLDNAATTPVFKEVSHLMAEVMEEDYGNPSSRHAMGIMAEKYITGAADTIAGILKCEPKEIIFTSGGTEANNIALIGAAMAHRRRGRHIITTSIEHASVHGPLAFLEEQGFEVSYLPVDKNGRLDETVLKEAVREDTILVSVMYVNNEIGSVQDIRKLCGIVKKINPGTLFHTDAVQAYGKYKIIPKRLGVDLLSASGHKIHGPKGSGFLYIKNQTKINPVTFGGGQQRDMRPGTENVPAIAGLGLASKLIYEDNTGNIQRLYNLKKRLAGNITQTDGVEINGMDNIPLEETAPHIISISFEGIRSEVLLNALSQKGIFVSSGSACSSNHPQLSGTLKAIGMKDSLAGSSLRFSFSLFTTEEQIDYAADVIREELPVLRKFTSC